VEESFPWEIWSRKIGSCVLPCWASLEEGEKRIKPYDKWWETEAASLDREDFAIVEFNDIL
jgi:hypothetical protein